MKCTGLRARKGRPRIRVARAVAGLLAVFGALLVTLGCAGLQPVIVPATSTSTPTSAPTKTPTPEPTATLEPTPEPIEPGLVALQEQLRATVDGYWVEGHYSFAVTDLQTGQTVGVNLDQQQLSGCVMNLFIILVVLRDVEAGAYPMETVEGLIRATLWSSNAETAYELYTIAGFGDPTLGVRKVAALHRELGFELTIIDHPPAFGDDTVGVNADNWATAREVNAALEALYKGEILGPAMAAYLLDAMVEVKAGLNYLTAWGNGGVTSHKNGFFPYSDGYVDNDVGIVQFERNGEQRAYAVGFFSDGVPYKYGDIVLGQQLMSLAWEYFDAAYPVAQ
ncbi:MAG TPA: serine hydrolase [Tepidiformaceae bacterium]|nr:serine hydrolase [Tepidiformaceae bacterium]